MLSQVTRQTVASGKSLLLNDGHTVLVLRPAPVQALDNGACVNAYCRGPDKWINISMGEIAGADEVLPSLNQSAKQNAH